MMAVRITVIADHDIEDIPALDLQDHLLDFGIEAQRVRITRLTKGQHEKALA